jgi:hypothetical protein
MGYNKENLHIKYPSLSKDELKIENEMLKAKIAHMEKRLNKDVQYITFNNNKAVVLEAETNNSLYDTGNINFYEEKLLNMKRELENFDALEC